MKLGSRVARVEMGSRLIAVECGTRIMKVLSSASCAGERDEIN